MIKIPMELVRDPKIREGCWVRSFRRVTSGWIQVIGSSPPTPLSWNILFCPLFPPSGGICDPTKLRPLYKLLRFWWGGAEISCQGKLVIKPATYQSGHAKQRHVFIDIPFVSAYPPCTGATLWTNKVLSGYHHLLAIRLFHSDFALIPSAFLSLSLWRLEDHFSGLFSRRAQPWPLLTRLTPVLLSFQTQLVNIPAAGCGVVHHCLAQFDDFQESSGSFVKGFDTFCGSFQFPDHAQVYQRRGEVVFP